MSIYRKVLASQPDNSVTIITVGFLSNLSNLLRSEPDTFSNLNGKELVKLKVKQLVSMAGGFPEGNEFNVNKHASASVEVFRNWPTPILFSGAEIGSKIFTGGKTARQEIGSPVQKGYDYNLKTYRKDVAINRQSWDQTAVLIAVRDPRDYFYLSDWGKFVISNDGTNLWNPDINAGHRFIIHKYPYSYIEKIIEDLMLHRSKSK